MSLFRIRHYCIRIRIQYSAMRIPAPVFDKLRFCKISKVKLKYIKQFIINSKDFFIDRYTVHINFLVENCQILILFFGGKNLKNEMFRKQDPGSINCGSQIHKKYVSPMRIRFRKRKKKDYFVTNNWICLNLFTNVAFYKSYQRNE